MGYTNKIADKIPVKIKKLENFAGELPKYATEGSSGFDVRAQTAGMTLTLAPGERTLIPTGLSFEIPVGFEIQARPRSGLAIKHGFTLVNTPGTIDADYRGEVKIIGINLGKEPFVINDQDRIAQLVIAKVEVAEFMILDTLTETTRGAGGFGHTGVNV